MVRHCQRGRDVRSTSSRLSARFELREASDWSAVRRLASLAECAVLVWPHLSGNHAAGRLSTLDETRPELPIVVATRRSAEEVRRVCHVRIQEIVWYSELRKDGKLCRAVGRARERAFLRGLSHRLDRDRVPTHVRRALILLLRTERPPRTVAALSDAVACDRRTLWREWRGLIGDESDLTLKEVLGWLQLLRAVAIHGVTGSWERTADSLRLSRSALARTTHRLAGESLGDLAATDPSELRARFLSRFDGTPLADLLAPREGR